KYHGQRQINCAEKIYINKPKAVCAIKISLSHYHKMRHELEIEFEVFTRLLNHSKMKMDEYTAA
ncbi:MAG: hypothetical protein LBV27_06270, partial [Oscillospiraceae bacterium]|nr:hypothetical protein [Oscillospiraceae bacterium]